MRKSCKFNQLVLILSATLLSSYVMSADHQGLEKRVAALEAKAEEKGEEATWYDRLRFSGLIEIEASYTDPDSDDSESDLVVATAELGVEAELNENLSAALVLLYEEDEDGVDVDIATINYELDNGLSFTLGQDYVPFGSFGTALVSDTLALELGETRETALIVGYEQGGFSSAFYIFNGDNDEKEKQKINDYGFRVSFNGDNFTIGGDYISNLGDSDGLTDAITYGINDDAIAGSAIFTELSLGAFTIFAEHLSALDGYEPESNAEPSASQIEVAFETGDFTYALSFQQTDEAEFLEFPEDKTSIGMSTEIWGGLGLGIELSRDESYEGDTTNNIVIQLAAEF
jgi:hypothetical protein